MSNRKYIITIYNNTNDYFLLNCIYLWYHKKRKHYKELLITIIINININLLIKYWYNSSWYNKQDKFYNN